MKGNGNVIKGKGTQKWVNLFLTKNYQKYNRDCYAVQNAKEFLECKIDQES